MQLSEKAALHNRPLGSLRLPAPQEDPEPTTSVYTSKLQFGVCLHPFLRPRAAASGSGSHFNSHKAGANRAVILLTRRRLCEGLTPT